MLLHPLCLILVNRSAGGAFRFHPLQGLGERLRLFRYSKNEFMVANIHSRGQKLARFRISSSDYQVLAAHDIPLEASSNKPVNVVSNWNNNLAGQMTTFLTTV